MSPALLEAPARLFADLRAPAPRDSHTTLGARLDAAWSQVQTDTTTECPVCRARMVRHGSAAQCTGCGSRLT